MRNVRDAFPSGRRRPVKADARLSRARLHRRHAHEGDCGRYGLSEATVWRLPRAATGADVRSGAGGATGGARGGHLRGGAGASAAAADRGGLLREARQGAILGGRASGRRSAPCAPSSAGTSIRRSRQRWRDSRSMQKPRALAPGDRIAVVAPASPFARDEFEAGLSGAASARIRARVRRQRFARRAYVAGDATVRAASFQQAWADGSVRALIAVRGGYGSAQLLPLFNSAEMRRTPKAFIGYSDNTSILAWLTTRCGVVSFRSHAGGTPGTRRSGVESVVVRARADARGAGRAVDASPTRDLASRRSRWHTGRRYLDPTPGITRDAIRFDPLMECALHRRGCRASVSPGPHAHAAAIRRSARPRRRRGVW